jgi:hypothetical protein
MMPGIKTTWVLTNMNLQIVEKPLTLAMKIMVLTEPYFNLDTKLEVFSYNYHIDSL